MKKLIVTVSCLVALTFAAIPVGAQTRARSTTNAGYGRSYNQRSTYRNQVNRDSRYGNVYDNYDYRNGNWRDRSVWDNHRDKITTAGGAVAGAVIGGLIGGKRGAILGAVAGGGGAALYTYKIRDNRRY
ncbi:MAG: hypothetical protein ABR555_19200 [Pyrinomonadaceae bacterium]